MLPANCLLLDQTQAHCRQKNKKCLARNSKKRNKSMKQEIQVFNYRKNAIPDFSESKYWEQIQLMNTAARYPQMSDLDRTTDIIVVFIDADKDSCLKKISSIAQAMTKVDIIAAVARENTDTGIQSLQSGASDFIILPATAAHFDIYINRALERLYLHSHTCFNENCYKSRFARSQKNYHQLFNAVPCFIFVQDQDYHITDANRKFEEYFGHHVGSYCFGICKNRDEPCRKCPARNTLRDGTSHASEMEIISSDGVKHVVLCWTAPIRDTNGEITHSLVMLTDITEARRLEDHLASLGFMIGSISHGIKGLLTSLDGGLYLMETGFKTDHMDKVREGYELSRDMTARIKNLVMDILYYTKTRTLEWEVISCQTFVEETLKVVTVKAEKHGIQVRQGFESLVENDSFEIDKSSLQAALVNILENGIEACLDDAAAKDRDKDKVYAICLFARVDKEKVVFKIQDNGLGMDKATLKNIFTIFFSSKGNKGTGLGLFIANKVIGQHRGEIKVVSGREKGTKFIIKIPRSVPMTARHPRGTPEPLNS
jgi:PAS domain S-box-containing protein